MGNDVVLARGESFNECGLDMWDVVRLGRTGRVYIVDRRASLPARHNQQSQPIGAACWSLVQSAPLGDQAGPGSRRENIEKLRVRVVLSLVILFQRQLGVKRGVVLYICHHVCLHIRLHSRAVPQVGPGLHWQPHLQAPLQGHGHHPTNSNCSGKFPIVCPSLGKIKVKQLISSISEGISG